MVSVTPLGGETLERRRVSHLRKLVAGAIAGLKPSNVTVTDTNGQTYAGSGEDGAGDPLEDPYYARKNYYEKELKRKIEDIVSYIAGAKVHVNAVLDTSLLNEQVSVKVDPKPVVTQAQTVTSSKRVEGSSGGGRPGLTAQGGPAAGPATVTVGQTSSTNEEETTESSQSVVSTDTVRTKTIGLTPKNVRATISVPSTYYVKVWNKNNPVPEGSPEGTPPPEPLPADLDKIRNDVKTSIEMAVVALLPAVPSGEDPVPNVTVTTFEPVMIAAIEPPTFSQDALAWTGQYWSTLSVMGLAVFSLLMLRSMVRAAPVRSGPRGAEPVSSGLSIVAEDEPGEVSEDQSARLKRRFQSGPSLKDDLSEMVKEDPDAAAAILSNWISSAG